MAADYAELGDSSAASGSLSEEAEQTADNTPSISGVNVSGDFNEGTRGPDYFKNIKIDLIGENLTEDNFLTEEGLRWTDKTEVELISGREVGHLNSSSNFGSERPSVPVKMFSTDNGSSGRITYVGETKSGIDLDLIWEIEDSDKDDWEANSGLNRHGSIRGIGFSGEQFFPNAIGNSISVLYNNANNISINYKIVKHGTMDENQVVLSFISSDIDTAQGVSTDLANLAELIPSASNLVKDNDIIYDATPGTVGLNGSRDLPRGGYLGAGFLSAFNYTFYSPAPPRYGNSFNYSMAVRYALFGSSLQAKLETKVNQHIRVEYIDEQGTPIKQAANLKGITGYSYRIDKADILNYSLIGVQKDISNINKPIIRFVYRKNPVQESTANSIAPQNRTKRTRRSIQSNSVKANRTYKAVTNSSAKSYTKSNSSKKDPFLVNTGMNADEKKEFIQYLKEVEKNARKKYGNNRDKINHEVANAIMYPSYSMSFLQNHANSINTSLIPIREYSSIITTLNNTNKSGNYPVDLPHMACPLGSYEKSSRIREMIKFISVTPFTVESPKTKFFYLNSLTGDIWTNINDKDMRSDKDAFIFKFHPKYRGRLYSDTIIEYYNQDDLNRIREEMYSEALRSQAGPGISADEQNFLNHFWASLSFGGIALMGIGVFGFLKKEFEKGRKNFVKKVGEMVLAWIGIVNSLPSITANTLNKVVNIYVKKLFYQRIIPCINYIKKQCNDKILKNKYFTARVTKKKKASIYQNQKKRMKSVKNIIKKPLIKMKKTIVKIYSKSRVAIKNTTRLIRKTCRKVTAKAKKVAFKAKRVIKNIFRQRRSR